MTVDLPQYDVRQKWQSRDGLAGIEAFRIWILKVLPLLFGLRTCPFCPYCNHNEGKKDLGEPCQDVFGSNMLSCGGFCGGTDALSGAVEHQKDGNPHFHGHAHIVNIWQHGSLAEVIKRVPDHRQKEEIVYKCSCVVKQIRLRVFSPFSAIEYCIETCASINFQAVCYPLCVKLALEHPDS